MFLGIMFNIICFLFVCFLISQHTYLISSYFRTKTKVIIRERAVPVPSFTLKEQLAPVAKSLEDFFQHLRDKLQKLPMNNWGRKGEGGRDCKAYAPAKSSKSGDAGDLPSFQNSVLSSPQVTEKVRSYKILGTGFWLVLIPIFFPV